VAKPSVYIETTIISFLAARPSRDLVVAAKQRTTRDWWDLRRDRFDLYGSQFVVNEAADGDEEAAERRMQQLTGIPLLAVNEEVADLAEALVSEGVLPEKAATDAVHIALAAVHGIEFLLTWNCTHLANAQLIEAVDGLILSRGYEPPIICTPDELMGD
jgi:predicted nucleic acid-binding protein